MLRRGCPAFYSSELPGFKIAELFLGNVLLVVIFYRDETFLNVLSWSHNDKGRSIRLISYPFDHISIFFFTLYKLTWDVVSSFPFSLEVERKRFFFIISPNFCNQSHKIHSIDLIFSGSFSLDFGDHLWSRIICGPFWGSANLGQSDFGKLSIVKGSKIELDYLWYRRSIPGSLAAHPHPINS